MRTSHRWKSKPGSFDALNTFTVFESSNRYGIPDIRKDEFIPKWLIPVKQRVGYDEEMMLEGAVHFFVDDYRYEVVWNRPQSILKTVKQCGRALSPDFSLYVDDPVALQIWNTYRSRWVTRYWQSQGIEVIPSVTWSDDKSYEFCFLGIPRNSIIAVSTVGACSNKEVEELFVAGFKEMLKQLTPKKVLVYGETTPIEFEGLVDVKWYPSYWKTMRDIVSKKSGDK